MRETIEQTIHGFGRDIERETVVIGNAAAKLALSDFRESPTTDLVMSDSAFQHVRQGSNEWEAIADGQLVHETLRTRISVASEPDIAGLQNRGWSTKSNIHVAGLPDVYAAKQRSNSSEDVRDTTFIRERLQDVLTAPLPADRIPYELEIAKDCLPESLREDPEAQMAILLAANGLHTVYTVYGHPEIGQANQIVGELERPEFYVPATYHNGFGLADDARALQRHLTNTNATPEEHFLALATEVHTDAVYGNGRFRNNPNGYDELRSANLLYARALRLGFSDAAAMRMRDATLQTAFDEIAFTQRGKHAADPLARAVTGVDMHSLVEPNSVENTIDLAIEDGYSARYSEDRVLGRVFNEHDERVYSTAEGLELIDRYADVTPADLPDGPSVMQYFANRIKANARFQGGYEYPDGWTLDNVDARNAHVRKLQELGEKLFAREITAVQAGRLAIAHTHSMEEK